jgi:hypothetical protein
MLSLADNEAGGLGSIRVSIWTVGAACCGGAYFCCSAVVAFLESEGRNCLAAILPASSAQNANDFVTRGHSAIAP